jgi:glycosyltransferase involved in cell wall biosynthesis
MKLSIITINFNNKVGLEKTIQSVINQTYQDYEFLIIDGGSSDKSLELIHQYSSKIAYWVSESDTGIYNAMNKGIKHCKGQYIAFMNSGDYYLENNSLEKCLTEIIKNDADIYYGQHFVEHNKAIKMSKYPESISVEYLRHKVLNHQSCFFNRETLIGLGTYDERFALAADYHYYLKAFMANKKFHPILFPIVMYDLTGKSSLQLPAYKIEMDSAWTDIMPLWLNQFLGKYFELEKDYNAIRHKINYSRVLKIAFKLSDIKRKIFHGRH